MTRGASFPDDVGDLHQAGDVVAFDFAEFGVDELDGLLDLGDDDVFEDVDASAGHLELDGEQAGLLLLLGQLDEAVERAFEGAEGDVELAGGGGVAVAENVALDVLDEVGDLDVHNRGELDDHVEPRGRHGQGGLDVLRLHRRPREHEPAEGLGELPLDLLPQRLDVPRDLDQLARDLVALLTEQAMPPRRQRDPLAKPQELHSCGTDVGEHCKTS